MEIVITQKQLTKIQGNGIPIQNKFDRDRDRNVKVKIENLNEGIIPYLFSFMVSFVIFKPCQYARIEIENAPGNIIGFSTKAFLKEVVKALTTLAQVKKKNVDISLKEGQKLLIVLKAIN